MKNKKIMLMLTILFSAFTLCEMVDAATIRKFPIKIDDKYVRKLYDREGSNDNPHVATSNTQFLTVDRKAAYCVDFSISTGMGAGFTYWEGCSGEYCNDPATAGFSQSLKDYLLATGKFTEETATAAVNDLNLIYYFGYHDTVQSMNVSETNKKNFLATQALIWEKLSDYGMYRNLSTKELTDLFTEAELAGRAPETKSSFVISNVRYLKQPFTIPVVSSDVVALTQEKKAIKDAASAYYTVPSFCTSNTTDLGEITVGSSRELIDRNEVLSNFNVTCDNNAGVTCTKSGNKLIITAGDKTADEVIITLTKTVSGINSQSTVYAYKENTNSESYQGFAVLGGNLPTVRRQLKIKVVASTPNDGCYICGTGNDAQYQWGNFSSNSNCTLQAEINDVASCKPNPGCYVCDDEYVWSNDGEPQGEYANCELQEDIEDEEHCKYVPPVVPQSSQPEPTSPPTGGMRIAYISLICGVVTALGFVYFYSKKPENE